MTPALALRLIPPAVATVLMVTHWLLPRLTRPELYFAVTVAPGFRDGAVGRSILRRYRRELSAVFAVTLALLAACALTAAFSWDGLVLLLQIGASFGVFYRARGLVLPCAVSPTSVREARFTGRDRRIPGGWVGACGPFALLAACAGYLWAHWQQIPARLVIHWGAQGQPDRWAARSPGRVFFPLLDAAAVIAALTLMVYGIAHWTRPIYASGPRGVRESRFRTIASALLLLLEYVLALQSSWIAIQPILSASQHGPPAGFAPLLVLPLLVAIVSAAALMRLGQGGNRIPVPQRPGSASTETVGDRTEDRFWKLGIIYCNRDDLAVLVEKRFGIGYTVNFARPVAWIIMFLVLLAPIIIAFLAYGRP